jgi:putative protease
MTAIITAKLRQAELLAPAGNLEKMKTAFAYGADAVYLGIPDYSLRVRINDFDMTGIGAAIKYAHGLKKKVYVTINIFAHQKHLKSLPAYLRRLQKLKPDGVIVSDPGVLEMVKKYLPRVAIHLSTQANCTNAAAVKFWQKQGVKRIILGREVTLTEIKEIHRACPKMELEYFVHGAMCVAYSGRCFLSKEYLDRSANLGDCAQPCRWEYETKARNRLSEEVFIRAKGHDEIFELVAEPHGAYLLNSLDLCLIKYLRELAKAGIVSFKIEGRAKSVYYIANIVGIYKEALAHPKKADFLAKELNTKLVHRGYTVGFLLGGKAGQNIKDAHNKVDWEFCGQVLESPKKTAKDLKEAAENLILIRVHNTLKTGDEIEIILPFYDIIRMKVGEMTDAKTGQKIAEAHGGGGGRQLYLPVNLKKDIPALTVIRRKLIGKTATK